MFMIRKKVVKPIRLVALDLDGTTFTSDKKITRRTQHAIAAAIQRGVIVMPSTGRPASTLPEEFINIKGVQYALTSNGGAVVSLPDKKIIYGDFVPTELACEVIDRLLSFDALTEVYHGGICYADRTGYHRLLNEYKHMPDWFKAYVVKSRTPVPDLREQVYKGQLKIEKFLSSFDDMEERARAFESLRQLPVSVCQGNAFNMEVSAKTATKGNTLLAFAKMMGIAADEIMVCGDTENDETMFEVAGLRVAMGNADDTIKAMADVITASNDEDGVAVALEQLIIEKGN